MPRCKECVYVPDLDEWACAVCRDALKPMAALRALLRFRLVDQSEVDAEGDELEDAEFDADELGLTEDDDPEGI